MCSLRASSASNSSCSLNISCWSCLAKASSSSVSPWQSNNYEGYHNRILHGRGWKTVLSNPMNSGGKEWTRVQRGFWPSAGPRVGHTCTPSPSMLDSFSCLYHRKCTCYKEKLSKSRECLTTFAFMLMTWAKFGSKRFLHLACLLALNRALVLRVLLI